MLDITKRVDASGMTVKEFIGVLLNMPMDYHICCCGDNNAYVHVDHDNSAICIDHSRLDELYRKEPDEEVYTTEVYIKEVSQPEAKKEVSVTSDAKPDRTSQLIHASVKQLANWLYEEADPNARVKYNGLSSFNIYQTSHGIVLATDLMDITDYSNCVVERMIQAADTSVEDLIQLLGIFNKESPVTVGNDSGGLEIQVYEDANLVDII